MNPSDLLNTGALGSTQGALSNYGLQQQQYWNTYAAIAPSLLGISGDKTFSVELVEKKKRMNTILHDLRREIDDWHGDILDHTS